MSNKKKVFSTKEIKAIKELEYRRALERFADPSIFHAPKGTKESKEANTLSKLILNYEKRFKINKQTNMTNAQKLGFNYVYHYNEYQGKWYCIHRDSLLNYWSKNIKGAYANNWTVGSTAELAAAAMVKSEAKKK